MHPKTLCAVVLQNWSVPCRWGVKVDEAVKEEYKQQTEEFTVATVYLAIFKKAKKMEKEMLVL